MLLTRKVCIVGVIAGLTVVGAVSCGSASNNDQGTSFLALGWYTFKEGSEDEVVPVSGARSLLGSDTPVITGVDGAELRVLMGVQNRLSSQFLRVNRVDCRYEVQGADPSLTIPSEAIATSFVLGPTGEGDEGDEGTAAVSARASTSQVLPQVAYLNVDVISTDIFSFLNVNRNRLPELPFNLTAICNATGITQAGDVLTTNDVFFAIYFYDSAECCTGAGAGSGGGFQVGTGTGGDIDSFSGAED